MEENNIVNPNAEQQEQAPVAEQQPQEQATATTNEPAQDGAEEAVAQPEAAQPQPVQNDVKVQAPVAETVAAHDDFDWSIDKRNVAHYSKEDQKKYDKVYEDTFVQI